LVAGLCRLGQWFRAASPAVIHGMLAGIGILIVSSQIHVMVDDRPRQDGLSNLLSIPEALRKALPTPGWENHEQPRPRLELLQTVGKLHEQQSEIAGRVAQIAASHHGDSAAHDEQHDKQLEPSKALQQATLEELKGLSEAGVSLGKRDADEFALPRAITSA